MPDERFALNVPGSISRAGALEAAANIRLLVLDVDGVCTDGSLLYLPDGTALKSFNSQDGIGLKTAVQAGLHIGVITGRDDSSVRARFTQMGVTDYMPGFSSKLEPLKEICARHNLSMDQAAFLGDDWIDLDPMRAVGLPMAVANARPEVKAEALYVSGNRGGDGAVREAIEFILAARPDSPDLVALWTSLAPAARKK